MKNILAALLLACVPLPETLAQSRQQDRDAEAEQTRCIPTSDITGYKVESDSLVRLKMRGASDVIMRLKRHCPQLHFHKYISYTPVNGKLCEGLDDVVSRSGMPCRIASFSDDPVSSAPQSQTGDDGSR